MTSQTKQRKLEKQQAIFQATLDISFEKGIGNTSTAAIAAKAGIAVGTLFSYFPSKVSLINSLYKNIIEEVTFFVTHSFTKLPSYNNEALLRQIWCKHIEWHRAHPLETDFIKTVLNANGDTSPYVTQETQEALQPCYAEMQEVFQQAVKQGVVKPLPPMLLLRVFVANSVTVSGLYQKGSAFAVFLEETPQVQDSLEEAAWNLIAVNP